MPELRAPIEGLQAPHITAGQKPPASYGKGRTCVECGGNVNQYTAPQPKTGDALCNLHWKLPDGYTMSASGVVKARSAGSAMTATSATTTTSSGS